MQASLEVLYFLCTLLSRGGNCQEFAIISKDPILNLYSRPTQYDNNRNNDSPSSNQFVWPANYLATSTPVTSSSLTPVPANQSPARNYHHHLVGLPVASTQYRSPYAVPQSSSGSSASTRDPAPPPPPPLPAPPPTTSSYLPPTNYANHALPVSRFLKCFHSACIEKVSYHFSPRY